MASIGFPDATQCEFYKPTHHLPLTENKRNYEALGNTDKSYIMNNY